MTDEHQAEHEPETHRHHDECYACPIGGFFLTARGSSPETVEHLMNAAAELVAAARSVLEAAESFIEQQRGPQGASVPGDGSKVRRIDLEP